MDDREMRLEMPGVEFHAMGGLDKSGGALTVAAIHQAALALFRAVPRTIRVRLETPDAYMEFYPTEDGGELQRVFGMMYGEPDIPIRFLSASPDRR